MDTPPQARYARNGATHLAHQVGEDPANMTDAASGAAPRDNRQWLDPAVAPCLRKLASLGHFIIYDTRGVALSGPAPGSAVPTIDDQVDEDADPVLDTIEEFVTGVRPVPSPDRFLGTVLFVDVADSTRMAADIGDSRFRDLLSAFVQLVRRQVDRQQGRLVDTAGDGALALFGSPARAIVCAEAVRDGVRALGLAVRAGVHTGEMEHGPAGEVRGIAVHTGTRVAALAGPGEILVSRTIRDLVAGRPHSAGKPRDARAQGRARLLGDIRGHQLRSRNPGAVAGLSVEARTRHVTGQAAALRARLTGPLFHNGQIGELWRTREYVGQHCPKGLQPLLAARVALARTRLLLALEHDQGVVQIWVLLVLHDHRPQQARVRLLDRPQLLAQSGRIFARLQPPPHELRPHIRSPLDVLAVLRDGHGEHRR